MSDTITLSHGGTIPSEPLDGRHDEFLGIVNLTPHDLRIIGPMAPSDGPDIVLNRLPGAEPIRIPERRGTPEHLGQGLWLTETFYVAELNLPPAIPGRRYVVSQVVLMCLAIAGIDRPDFIAPDTGEGALRDADGRIIGTSGFIRTVRG